jgi:tetratricopeptide (TPR) repeat protein/tRNA A-37 threonylcarbamoyl transferase component Bud32
MVDTWLWMARDATTEPLDGPFAPTIARGAGEAVTRVDRVTPAAARPTAGSKIGRYLVIAELGSGGMGVVLRAYDPKLHREVALKIVGARSTNGQARLVREARALAQINHRNVVAVYDVETEHDHGVILAMELVDGMSLQTWLSDAPRPWRDVLPKFIAAGRGLAAAHAKGLLHRDFKPGNVLVGDDERVRVTDFGLARAARAEPSEDPTEAASRDEAFAEDLTRTGLVMGTPGYMAPEQHEDRHLTQAADQYAFCVALWEALAGERPFRGATLAVDKLRGPPPWPSAIDVPVTIVQAMKRGLSPEPGDRFASMNDLLAALGSATRRRRPWAWIGLAATSVAALGAFALLDEPRPCRDAAAQLTGIWDETRRDAIAEAFEGSPAAFARDTWQRVRPDLDAYARAWIAMHVDACEATAVRGEQSEAVLDLRMACLQRARADLRATSDLLLEADVQTLDRAHDLVSGLPLVGTCADVDALQRGIPPPPPEHVELVRAAEARLSEAQAQLRAGRYDAVAQIVNELRATTSDLDYAPTRVLLTLVDGQLASVQGRREDAEAAFREVLELGLERRDGAPRIAAIELVTLASRQSRYDEALAWATVARGVLGKHVGGLGEVDLLNAEAVVFVERGQLDEADRRWARALELLEATPDGDATSIAMTRINRVRVLVERGDMERGREEMAAASEAFERAVGAKHPKMAAVLCNRAMLELAAGEAERARDLAVRGAELDGTPGNGLVNCLNVVGLSHAALGEVQEAIAVFERGLGIAERALGADHPLAATMLTNLAHVQAEHDVAAAEEAARRSIAILEATHGPEHAHISNPLFTLGRVLARRGRFDEAIEALERSVELRGHADADVEHRAAAAFELAKALWDSDRDRPRALALARRARAELSPGGNPQLRADLDAWLTPR